MRTGLTKSRTGPKTIYGGCILLGDGVRGGLNRQPPMMMKAHWYERPLNADLKRPSGGSMPVTTTRARTLTVHCRTLNPSFVRLRDHQTPEFGLRSWTSSGGGRITPLMLRMGRTSLVSLLVGMKSPGWKDVRQAPSRQCRPTWAISHQARTTYRRGKEQPVFPLVIFSPVRGERRDDHSPLTDGEFLPSGGSQT